MTEDLDMQLARIWQEAHAGDLAVTLPEIRSLLKSTDPENRLRGLLLVRRHIDERDLKDEFFQLAKPMIEDENNNCRWQALIVIGEFIQSKPDEVWRVVREYAEIEDDDMRSGVAKVLLEHLLEYYTKYDQPVKHFAEASPLFADTLSRCSDFRKYHSQQEPEGDSLKPAP